MNYDKIILELLDRIKTLEDKVAALEARQAAENAPEEKVNLTAKAREYITFRKEEAKLAGEAAVVLVCNDIQKTLGVINRAPAVCSAMYACMKEGDEVLYAPPKGMSTTVKIKYYV